MRFSFAALVDFWRARLQRIDALLSRRSRGSWGLRLERRVLCYCLRRYADAPYAAPPTQAAPLDPEGAERAWRLWLIASPRPALDAADIDPAEVEAADVPIEKIAKPHSPLPYLLVAVALLVMTGLTLAVSFWDLGNAGNIVAAMAIAATKASLVMTFFMHLKYERSTLILIALLPWLLAAILCAALFPDIVFGQHQ